MGRYFNVMPRIKRPSPLEIMKGQWYECETQNLVARYLFYNGSFYLISIKEK